MKERWKRLFDALKTPKTWVIWTSALATLVGAACSLTFVFIGYAGVFAYLVYAFAGITLAYSTYLIVCFFPKIKAGVRGALRKKKFTRDLAENYFFRTLVFALCSFIVNLGFVAFNTVFAILTGNGWFASLAGYYFLLSALRGGVFYGEKRVKKLDCRAQERARLIHYGLCGGALFLLDVAMSVAVAFMVLDKKPTKYTEITAIVFAAFTFYKVSLAIWNIFKAKKTRDLQIQAFRNIGVVDAAISLLSLQITLVATFSEDGSGMLVLNALTGAFVCLFTMGVGIFMIVKTVKGLKENGKSGISL